MTNKEIEKLIEKAFKEGWRLGYSDGGDHDCRMIEPSAQNRWNEFKLALFLLK